MPTLLLTGCATLRPYEHAGPLVSQLHLPFVLFNLIKGPRKAAPRRSQALFTSNVTHLLLLPNSSRVVNKVHPSLETGSITACSAVNGRVYYYAGEGEDGSLISRSRKGFSNVRCGFE